MAGNARLEQELLVLRQKLQASRGSKGSLTALAGSQSGQQPDSISYAGSASAVLESGSEECFHEFAPPLNAQSRLVLFYNLHRHFPVSFYN